LTIESTPNTECPWCATCLVARQYSIVKDLPLRSQESGAGSQNSTLILTPGS